MTQSVCQITTTPIMVALENKLSTEAKSLFVVENLNQLNDTDFSKFTFYELTYLANLIYLEREKQNNFDDLLNKIDLARLRKYDKSYTTYITNKTGKQPCKYNLFFETDLNLLDWYLKENRHNDLSVRDLTCLHERIIGNHNIEKFDNTKLQTLIALINGIRSTITTLLTTRMTTEKPTEEPMEETTEEPTEELIEKETEKPMDIQTQPLTTPKMGFKKSIWIFIKNHKISSGISILGIIALVMLGIFLTSIYSNTNTVIRPTTEVFDFTNNFEMTTEIDIKRPSFYPIDTNTERNEYNELLEIFPWILVSTLIMILLISVATFLAFYSQQQVQRKIGKRKSFSRSKSKSKSNKAKTIRRTSSTKKPSTSSTKIDF